MAYVVPDQEHCLRASNLPNFVVWIEIDGQAAPVYSKTESEDHKTVICYIESEEGKQFKVCFADLRQSSPQDPYSVQAYVDGNYCNGSVFKLSDSHFKTATADPSRFVTYKGKETSHTTEEPFLFSKLQLTDDDAVACTDENALKGLGTIKVRYRRIRNIRSCTGEPKFSSAKANEFHEKAKKAQLSHQAAFAAPIATEPQNRLAFDFVDDKDHPLQTFEFRYRSRQLLQLEKHIPDSPVPSPRGSPSPEILDAHERDEAIARLQRQIDALKKGTASASPGPSGTRKVKSEDEGGREKKRVKKEKEEVSSASAGKGKGKEKEVIVLSDSE